MILYFCSSGLTCLLNFGSVYRSLWFSVWFVGPARSTLDTLSSKVASIMSNSYFSDHHFRLTLIGWAKHSFRPFMIFLSIFVILIWFSLITLLRYSQSKFATTAQVTKSTTIILFYFASVSLFHFLNSYSNYLPKISFLSG